LAVAKVGVPTQPNGGRGDADEEVTGKVEPHKSRVYSINDFVNWYRSRELKLDPRFQRRSVWDPKARSYLIDTILRGLPVPILYIRQVIDPTALKTMREVVDGQQRLRAVLDFIEDKLTVLRSHNPDFGGRKFSDLTDDERRTFLDYPFSVDILGDASDADVLEVFSRLNSYTLTLNAQEKLNAKYYGQFKQTVYALGRQHLEFWRQNRILTDRAIVRMGEAEFTSELVVTMLDGLQHGKSKVESFYEQYDEEFPQAKRVSAALRATIDEIAATMGDAIRSTAFHLKAHFYSLFALFYDSIYGLPGSEQRTKIPATRRAAVRDALVNLVAVLKQKEPPQDMVAFVQASRSSTDNLPQRTTRHQFMLNALRSAIEEK
jgi:hypothetical protein